MHTNPSFAFFGTPDVAVYTLEALRVHDMLPVVIITAPARPLGRHQTLTPSPVALWGATYGITVLTPEKITPEFIAELSTYVFDLSIVAAYGKILPQSLLDLKPTLNIHPSLLPHYRGPSPLQAPLLHGDTQTGVSIMLLDREVDHGPIYIQETHQLTGTETTESLGELLFTRGGELLVLHMTDIADSTLTYKDQEHAQATFTRKVLKEDGHVDLTTDSPEILDRKYRAYTLWPGIFFTTVHASKTIRVKISHAHYDSTTKQFIIEKVIPEGKKEISWDDFKHSYVTRA
jgi:methionyl-tRNA formyltransferase